LARFTVTAFDMPLHTQLLLLLLPQARRFEVIDEIVTAFESEYCKITDTQVLQSEMLMLQQM
jgi:hypothetical protein